MIGSNRTSLSVFSFCRLDISNQSLYISEELQNKLEFEESDIANITIFDQTHTDSPLSCGIVCAKEPRCSAIIFTVSSDSENCFLHTDDDNSGDQNPWLDTKKATMLKLKYSEYI